MLKLALRRIAGLVPTLLVIITVSFAIIRLAPGGPFEQEQALAPAVRANLERLYGLDQPLGVQYLNYLRALAHGDFGPSLRQRDFSVRELIAQGPQHRRAHRARHRATELRHRPAARTGVWSVSQVVAGRRLAGGGTA